MNFLFVHQNFPAQFGQFARALAQEGHRVVAIGEASRHQENIRVQRVGGLETICQPKMLEFLKRHE